MKIEYCEHTIRKPCNDQKWCCDRFRDWYRKGLLYISEGKYCIFTQNSNEPLIPFDFCPFCGEKIE